MNHTEAINWIKKAQDLGIDDGIPAFYNSEKNVWMQSYPEVSGYIIPTLIDAGEEERALKISRWLRVKQLADGSIGSGYWNSYFPNVFDTGQVLLGWLAAQELSPDPRTQESIDHAVSWLEDSWHETKWRNSNQTYTPAIHLRTLWPLKEAGFTNWKDIFSELYTDDYFSRIDEQFPEAPLTHFIVYVARSLYELDLAVLSRDIMERIAAVQSLSFPARLDSNWQPTTDEVCVPAVAQASILFRKLGMTDNADRALDYLSTLDAPWASDPIDGDYLPNSQVSWSAKFIADAWKAAE